MTTMDQIQALLAKIRSLPESRQLAAVEALTEIAEEPYVLSADELAILLPAKAEALAGECLSVAETDELLDKPWS